MCNLFFYKKPYSIPRAEMLIRFLFRKSGRPSGNLVFYILYLYRLDILNNYLAEIAALVWWPVLFLIIGGGLYFLIYSRFIQYKYFFHALNVLRSKYDDPNAPGQITAYKALSTALASTVGMGNLAGVAAAI